MTDGEHSASTIKLALELATPIDAPLPPISTEPFDAERPAFMLFTSGSTGNPKGVPMRHSALASFVLPSFFLCKAGERWPELFR